MQPNTYQPGIHPVAAPWTSEFSAECSGRVSSFFTLVEHGIKSSMKSVTVLSIAALFVIAGQCTSLLGAQGGSLIEGYAWVDNQDGDTTVFEWIDIVWTAPQILESVSN